MRKYLMFKCRDAWYVANSEGHITQLERFRRNDADFSGSWTLLGVSTHHWHCRVTVRFAEIWEKPALMINGYVWDKDHGTTRMWGGGGNIRVQNAYSFEA